MSHAHAQHAYDPADPHGFHEEGHHGHVIVSWQILLGVLLALLFFTVLTVFQAQFEKFAAHEWGWLIPGWVNVVLAMGIAVIKGTLVAMFFMQLRYDKGLNVVLFLFTLFAVWLFIMFTAIDLTGRGHITEWRQGEVISGGTLSSFGTGGGSIAKSRKDLEGISNKPIYLAVKENYIAQHGLAAYEAHAHHDAHGDAVSTAHSSRPRQGLTPGLFATGVWKDLAHDSHDSHDAHADESHAEPAPTGEQGH